MQSPLRSASPDGPGATFTWIVAGVVAVALLLLVPTTELLDDLSSEEDDTEEEDSVEDGAYRRLE